MSEDNGNPFDKPLNSELQEHQQQAAATLQASSNGNPFDEPLASEKAEAQHRAAVAANPEEQDFLKANPDHKYFPADPAFPNRPAGVYPTGKGNEWRQDPSYSQSPVDLQFAKHTAEGAGYGALGAGSAFAAPLADPVVTAVVSHLGKVKAILDAAGKLGLTGGGIGLGIKEARDLYKEFTKEGK